MSSIKLTYREIANDLPGKRISLFSFFKNYFYNAAFRVLLNHRLGKFFYKQKNVFLRQIAHRYKYKLITKRNCDISYNASIGKGLRLPHPLGIVIGNGVVIGDNVMIFQQVTFGSHGKKNSEMCYPVIANNVKIYAGAKIIGGVKVGENSIIGANTLVNKDVPANCIAYGIPCIIKEIEK